MKFTSIFFKASAEYIRGLFSNILTNEREIRSLLRYFSKRAQGIFENCSQITNKRDKIVLASERKFIFSRNKRRKISLKARKTKFTSVFLQRVQGTFEGNLKYLEKQTYTRLHDKARVMRRAKTLYFYSIIRKNTFYANKFSYFINYRNNTILSYFTNTHKSTATNSKKIILYTKSQKTDKKKRTP